MAVLQSDLYHKLEDDARAECDALLAGKAAPSPERCSFPSCQFSGCPTGGCYGGATR